MAPCEWVIDIIKEWVIAQAYATEAWVLAKVYATEAWVLEWVTPVHVTGTLDPDSTCTYHKAGTHNNEPYYVRDDGLYFIWWGILERWIISAALGVTAPAYWERLDPNIIGVYEPKLAASGAATVTSGYGCPHRCFVDRGDPAAFDFVYGDLTHNGAWHDLDLSGIVPAGPKAVSLFCEISSGVILRRIYFRKKGNVNDKNISKVFNHVAGIKNAGDCTVPLDADRRIQYLSNIPVFSTSNITVKGWWF